MILRSQPPTRTPPCYLAVLCLAALSLALSLQAGGQSKQTQSKQTQSKQTQSKQIHVTVMDENGVVVPNAQLTITQPNARTLQILTNYAGRAEFTLSNAAPYQLLAEKQGYYQTLQSNIAPTLSAIEISLAHEQILRQEVNVVPSTPTIDPQQFSDASIMSTRAIQAIPYVNSRDIRYLLPFNPGVIMDASGQIHIAGSPTYATLDTLDGFNLRDPDTGSRSLHVSVDAYRNIDIESTRYPVMYGRATGGVIAFSSGMGDDRFRFNATDFIPSALLNNGLHFDKFLPRVTFSGPIVKKRAWFFNGFDLDYSENYTIGLPNNANTNPSWEESNLDRFQINLTPRNSLFLSVLFNDLYSPFSGLSTLAPQVSTQKNDVVAWLPFFHDQQVFSNGTLLDVGIGITHIHNGFEPHGDTPYQITPETSEGSYFENLTDLSSRNQEIFSLYLPPHRWMGNHNAQFGIDLEQITFGQSFTRAPISYLREDGTILRQSTFPVQPPFTRHNADVSAYAQDNWQLPHGLSFQPGFRFDWDEIVRRPLYSPRIATVFAPGKVPGTKISAGIGVYYEHTQLEYLEEAFAGLRDDTYFNAAGTAPAGPALPTSFTADYHLLRAPRVINYSAELEQKLPFSTTATISYMTKKGSNFLVFADQNLPSFFGNYLLTNQRTSDYHAETITLRHNFSYRSQSYALFAAYTRSSATTNADVSYSPTIGELGPQQPGVEDWNVPNRVLSWGWLPTPLKRWDFVYALDWHTGLPYTAIDANQVVVGVPNAYTFPAYLSFSPGLEWKFHFRGEYYGLRGFFENITNRQNPTIVNNDIDSPDFGVFTEPFGRAFTARIQLIGSK